LYLKMKYMKIDQITQNDLAVSIFYGEVVLNGSCLYISAFVVLRGCLCDTLWLKDL